MIISKALWDKIVQKFPDTLTSQRREDFSDDPPLIITGGSGCGKTALLADWAKEYQQAHPDDLVFLHFCGSSPASSDPLNLLRRIMASLKISPQKKTCQVSKTWQVVVS
ncbi:MAG: NACHT domain-containing protein [Pseudomonadota bacterium]